MVEDTVRKRSDRHYRATHLRLIARSNPSVHAAISRIAFDDDTWHQALGQDGDERPEAAVAEVTHLIYLSGWPSGRAPG